MRQLSTWTALALLGFCTSAADADTWAERLGYPPASKVVILHANYLGASYEFNLPGQEMLEQGQVQSAAVMPPCPWFESFASWRRLNLDYDVGVCLTFNSPSDAYRWSPVSGADASPSLVDAEHYLWSSELQFALRADLEDIKREIDRQIEKTRAAGIRPTHLFPFLGSLITRPDALEAYLQAAEKYWIPAVIVEMTAENVDQLRNRGFPLTDEMIAIVDRYQLPKLDAIHLMPSGDSYDEKRQAFIDLVRNMKPGLTQIIAGAALESPGLKQITPNWENRVWDHRVLIDPEVREALSREDVVFTNWKEVMERFEGRYAPNAEADAPSASDVEEPARS